MPKVVLLIGVCFLLILLGSSGKKKTVAEPDSLTEQEAKIAGICESVRGVGECRVMVTVAEGEVTNYRGSAVIGTVPAKILGITVVCEGADDPAVRSDLIRMLSSMYDIGTNRVNVLKLSS